MAGCIPKPRDQMRSQAGAWERGIKIPTLRRQCTPPRPFFLPIIIAVSELYKTVD